jgi:glycine C-acetyltransferase
MRHDPLSFLAADLDSLKQQGLYRHLRILEGEQKPKTSFDHRQVVNLSSNNYLGLTTHPRLREAALEATRTLGVGSGSVRSIAGTMDIHMELERRRGVQAHRGGRRLPERLRRERRDRRRRLIQR